MLEAGTKVVTAAMESVAIKKPLTLDMDYELAFYITKSWNKSLEVCVEVFGNNGDTVDKLVDFYFTFVGVDDNGKPIQVKEYVPKTEKETKIAAQAQARKDKYLHSVKTPLTIEQVTEEEIGIINNLKTHNEDDPNSGVFVHNTQKEYLDSMVLRDINLHGRIFGGYILDNAFNIAWHEAGDFIENDRLPLVAAINRVNFLSPINVGEKIRYVVRTIYTHKSSLVQEVVVFAEDKKTKKKRKLNDCVFTMVAASGPDRIKTEVLKQVIPITDEEIIKWVESYRNQKQYEQSK